MTRLIGGADGRTWTVRGRMEFSPPAVGDDFEHDVHAGPAAGLVMGALVLTMLVVLIAWTPDRVVVPVWLPLAICLVLLFFPIRWVLRRPWTLVAETPGDQDERPAERWVGTVRGVIRVRQAAARVSRDIEVYSAPDEEGPLQPVD